MDVSGAWHGEYRYEHDDEGTRVTFTLRLTQDAAGLVSGTVSEGPSGMPEEGRIIGECRRGRLTFLKLMPVAYVRGPEGSQELSAFLAAAGRQAETSVEHPQLLYEGRLTADGLEIAGTWRLDDYVVPLKGGQTFWLTGGRGTWSAHRAND